MPLGCIKQTYQAWFPWTRQEYNMHCTWTANDAVGIFGVLKCMLLSSWSQILIREPNKQRPPWPGDNFTYILMYGLFSVVCFHDFECANSGCKRPTIWLWNAHPNCAVWWRFSWNHWCWSQTTKVTQICRYASHGPWGSIQSKHVPFYCLSSVYVSAIYIRKSSNCVIWR